MQTLQDRPTQPQNEVAGSDLMLDSDYVLCDVVHEGQITSEEQARQAQNIDNVRGSILEKINGIQEMSALYKRHLAAAGKGQDILEKEKTPDGRPLTTWDMQEIEGLMELDLARAEYCRVMIEHFKLCIDTFRRMLRG